MILLIELIRLDKSIELINAGRLGGKVNSEIKKISIA